MFKVPSSTPPSTPDAKRNGGAQGLFSASNPSTTPAGPPPTSFTDQSFTPAGPPPSSLFGSSQLHSGDALASSKPAFDPTSHLSSSTVSPPFHSNFFAEIGRAKNGALPKPSGLRKSFHVPSSSPPRGYSDEEMSEDLYREEGVDDEGGGEEEDHTMEDDHDDRNHTKGSPRSQHRRPDAAGSVPDTPRGIKRSRFGDTISSILQSSPAKATNRIVKESDIPKIAKSIASSMQPAELHEPDGFVLETEKLLSHLHSVGEESQDTEPSPGTQLSKITEQLTKTWHSLAKNDSTSPDDEGVVGAIGPPDEASPIRKANFVGSLLISLHHPPSKKPSQGPSAPRHSRHSVSTPEQPQPVPQVLLNWLAQYHDPYPGEITEVRNYSQGSTAHDRFWDIVYMAVLRGKVGEAIRLLEDADWSQALSALNDGQEQPGYKDRRLTNVNQVISSAIDILKACPAVTDGDWDVTGGDWMIFRRRVHQALSRLTDFAEGGNQNRGQEDEDDLFQAENFGISSTRSNTMALSTASRRAESRVPWTIYENLKALYRQLLGTPEEIIASSADWVEAAIGLTVWWDGEEDGVPRGSLAASRRSLRSSQHVRPVDECPTLAYRQKLASSLAYVTASSEEAALQVNTTKPIEVGLACVLADDIEGVVGLLRGWSVPITAAVVEIGQLWGWEHAEGLRSKGLMEGFDDSDLMVLEYGEEQRGSSKHDEILLSYAGMLSRRDIFRDEKGVVRKEGWEMAMSVLSRLQNAKTGRQRINELLDELRLESTERVDKVLATCNSLGLEEEALKTAERYADTTSQTSTAYGIALLYYARAHSVKKLKDVLDLLIACSLVESLAYPRSSDLDPTLKSLVTNPKDTLTGLARVDLQAAELISTYLSGYATLRKFYDVRDEEQNMPSSQKQKHSCKPVTTKRKAIEALITVIVSASDSIHGGLYDPDVDVVVQVDGLLALLGEALVFVHQTPPLVTPSQTLILLKAVEDLSTAPSLIFSQCEAFLASTLAHYHDDEVSLDPSDVLKKSMAAPRSNALEMERSMAGSAFEIIGSQMLGSCESEKGSTSKTSGGGGNRKKSEDGGEGGAMLGGKGGLRKKGKRGWDWRTGFERGAKGEDVVRVLRVGLAREMGRLWVEGW